MLTNLKKYLRENPRFKLLIGTPAYGGQVGLGYFNSIIEMTRMFSKFNLDFEIFSFGSESLITRARNAIVAKFMAGDYTHLLFIDADITFCWTDIFKLILKDKPLSAGLYPTKGLHWDMVKMNIIQDLHASSNNIISKSVKYAYKPLDNVVDLDKDTMMAEVKYVATGFMMIQRPVIETLIKEFPSLKYNNNTYGFKSDFFYDLFSTAIDKESGEYLSEDYLFCKRWRETGNSIYADFSISLNHTGIIDYIGNISLLTKESKNDPF